MSDRPNILLLAIDLPARRLCLRRRARPHTGHPRGYEEERRTVLARLKDLGYLDE